MEEWKLINGYDYSVSSLGRIRNNKTGRILKGVPNTFGYLQVFLYKNGKSKKFTIHQLVASYFLPDQNGNPVMYDYFSCYPIIPYSQSNKQTIKQTRKKNGKKTYLSSRKL